VIQFDQLNKIDFTLWTPDTLRHITNLPELPEELDAGYAVLLDKDGLASNLPPSTLRGYIPKPPSESEYIEHIENFLLDATYVAKFLYRGDRIAAHHILDEMMKQESLRPMLEWRMEIEHGWSLKPGPYMRRIQTWLRPELMAALENTYTGLDPAATWDALYNTIALMRTTAREVGNALGYEYPARMEERILAHVRQVQELPPIG
jgi:aminoglycoside 6-adenylyltransferase